MYARLDNGWIKAEFIIRVEQFVEFAKMHPECMDGEKIKCPCNHCKCQNMNYLDEDTVKVHLGRNGFVADYYRWYHHGETYVPQSIEQNVGQIDAFIHTKHGETFNAMQSMVYDATGPSFNLIDRREPESHNKTSFLYAQSIRARCHTPIPGPTRMADPNQFRGARLYTRLGIFTCFIKRWCVQVL